MGIKGTTMNTLIYLILVMKGRLLERKMPSGKDVARISHFRTSGYLNKKYNLCLKEKPYKATTFVLACS